MQKKTRTDPDKLALWQGRYQRSRSAYDGELRRMDRREQLYLGDRHLTPVTKNDVGKDGQARIARHVRNIIAENIESEISSSIPQPKVTARRREDEGKAKLIEDMIRDELNRLPMERINDQMERTVPIQGGGLYLVEWDSAERGGEGEITLTPVHPKWVIPQDGVETGIEDMDFVFVDIPQTKAYIRRRYGVDVADEGEELPEDRSADAEATAEDMVTQHIAYWRNDAGGIGLYSWVGDTQLEDLEDYQARRLPRCKACGTQRPKDEDAPCPGCGGTEWEETTEEWDELMGPVLRSDGTVIPGGEPALDPETGMPMLDELGQPVTIPTRIPFYKPDVYPLVLQKNISKFGCFLGDSDVDKIEDQQNTVNRLSMKIIDRLVKAGTRITLPPNAKLGMSSEDQEYIRLDNIEDRSYIGLYDFSGNLQYEMAYLAQVYEEARQVLGITDSWQGRVDSSATSGVAKQYAAAQSAGRLESKRIMKDAAYADLFRLIFQFKLAYADEARQVRGKDAQGQTQYETFNRFDFLEQDSSGEWVWNDRFLFACDSSAPLANNREQMWENTTAHLQAGAFGDPTQTQTLILYWRKMDLLHYPGAAETLSYLEERMQQEQMAAQQQAMMQQAMMQAQAAQPRGMTAGQTGTTAAGIPTG